MAANSVSFPSAPRCLCSAAFGSAALAGHFLAALDFAGALADFDALVALAAATFFAGAFAGADFFVVAFLAGDLATGGAAFFDGRPAVALTAVSAAATALRPVVLTAVALTALAG